MDSYRKYIEFLHNSALEWISFVGNYISKLEDLEQLAHVRNSSHTMELLSSQLTSIFKKSFFPTVAR